MNLDLDRAQRSLDDTRDAITGLDQSTLVCLADLIAGLADSQGILWTMGNGGSSSTGSHMACDVGKGISASHHAPIRALSINEQAVTQSAWANDYGFEDAMRNQLEQVARPGDAVLAISGSGNSANVVNAVRWARENGYPVAVLVGRHGGRLSRFADIELRVDSTDMQVIENVHLVVVHWLFKAMSSAESHSGSVTSTHSTVEARVSHLNNA
jgi:D-sedoheptulose 7-phosphate isomerase